MSRGRALLLSAALAALAAVLFGIFAVQLFLGGDDRLGDDTFDVNAAFLSRQIAQDGPVLFQDLSGGDRDIYVQHLGPGLDTGWRAFKATPEGVDRRCTLSWDRTASLFRDTRCGTATTFPADGTGLEQYRATVEGNKLVVDFRVVLPAP